jgi:hypothetical protein
VKVVIPLEFTVSALAPFSVPVKFTAPDPVEIVVALPRVTGAKVTAEFDALIVPFVVTSDGAVAISPPVKAVELPAALPIVVVPVLLNVVVPAIVLLVPVRLTL